MAPFRKVSKMQSQFCSAPVRRFNGSAAKLVLFATGDQRDQHGEADPREVLSPGIMAKIVDDRAERWRLPGGNRYRSSVVRKPSLGSPGSLWVSGWYRVFRAHRWGPGV